MESKKQLKEIYISPGEQIVRVLEQMDRTAQQILLVTNNDDCLLGTVTDGDVRRALLEGVDLNKPVSSIMNSRPKVLRLGSSLKSARQLMVKYGIRHVPLMDDNGRVVDLLMWQDLFFQKKVKKRSENVVIMAGGKGTRLDPFTKILPKPMIPLHDKPIIEVIMDRFHRQGFCRFILCLGYKAEIIRIYFNDDSRPYNVDFVQENSPLGTAGALSLLDGLINDSFILTNCDIIVELDYAHLLQYHKERQYSITVVGALKEFVVPYGVLHTQGERFWIHEKPNFHFLVNTGIYVLESALLPFVKKETYLDMPEFIENVQSRGMSVGIYPHHGQWFDVGQWDEYQLTLKAFDNIGLSV